MHLGVRALPVHDAVLGLSVPAWLLYPATAPAGTTSFGPYTVEAASEAPFEPPSVPASAPLVVISHGNGSTPWAFRHLAAHLVARGMIVAVLEHPGNNRNDNTLSDPSGVPKIENLVRRPRHLAEVVDAALADATVGPALSGKVGVVGQSIGAYTALALVGGRPSSFPDDVPLAARLAPTPELLSRIVRVPTEPHPRVSAAALLTPAIPFYSAPGALAAVRTPLLVLSGEADTLTSPAQVTRVLSGVPDPSLVRHEIVPRAGHFSFLSPFPPALSAPGFAPATDPEGFDRVGFQPRLFELVGGFLEAALR